MSRFYHLPDLDLVRAAGEGSPDCLCTICKNRLAFEVPKQLIEDFMNSRVVLFVGAGVSTENREVMKSTLFEDVCDQLRLDPKTVSFPEAMQRLEQSPAGRIGLLSAIRGRIEHVKSFPEIYENATRFHRELATCFFVDTMVTTNWDTFIEDECGALPFITDADLAFWDLESRRVMKLHGSIENLGSIVATLNDYRRCGDWMRNSVVGSVLKSLLATRTIVYVGYSLTDPDFIEVSSFVKQSLKGNQKQHFTITLDQTEGTKSRLEELDIKPVYTSGDYFLSVLKEHASSRGCFLSDYRFIEASEFLEILRKVRYKTHEIDASKYPQSIYCGFYQDGLIHAI